LVKLKSSLMLIAACALLTFGTQSTFGQEDCPDPTIITIGNATLDPCMPQRVNVPVFMENHCPVGGFNIRIQTTDPTWLSFTVGDTAAADTFGSRISDWESFTASVFQSAAYRINVTAIANLPGGGSPYLAPGNGLIFTIHMDYDNYLVCDSSQLLNFSNCGVSDTTGYVLYQLVLNRDSVYVLPGLCHDNPRGDANCSGTTNGIDVIYLVNFFKGIGSSFCCLCSGDVNNNDTVNGLDVTYFINYLKGVVPSLDPCD